MKIKIISLGTTAEERSEATIKAFQTGDINYIDIYNNQILKAIEEAKKYEAYRVINRDLTYFVTKSAKKENRWQLTCFDKNMLPLSDSEFSDKKKALEELTKSSNEYIEAIIM